MHDALQAAIHTDLHCTRSADRHLAPLQRERPNSKPGSNRERDGFFLALFQRPLIKGRTFLYLAESTWSLYLGKIGI